MSHTSQTPLVSRTFIALAAVGHLFLALIPGAQAEPAQEIEAPESVFQADLMARANPDAIMLIAGGLHRWGIVTDSAYAVPAAYKQAGLTAGINPGYSQFSLSAEWKPAIFAQLRLQYDYFGYFGANACLLSFPTSESKFGQNEIESLEGQEESTAGQRLLFQPVFTGKIGPVMIRNATDLGYYRFGGRGPYFYEAEYDTLLKDGDFLLNNQTAFLVEAWKGSSANMLLAGPFYEITHALDADINRQRTGLQFYWLPAATAWMFKQPRIYGRIGLNLQDRNRDNEVFFGTGFGADF